MIKKLFFLVLLIVILGIVGLSWYGGFFKNDVKVVESEYDTFYALTLDHIGPYYQIAGKMDSVRKYADANKIEYTDMVGLYYDDPKKVSKNELRSKGGVILKDDDVDVKEPYKITKVKGKDCLYAKFTGFSFIGAIKVYPLLNRKLSEIEDKQDGPAIEIYKKNNVIEYFIPVD